MIRRALLLSCFALAAFGADTAAGAVDVVANMAAALSDGNVAPFSSALSRQMPDRDRVLDNVRAMVAQADVKSSVEPLSNEGDEQKRTLVLDWALAMQRKGPDLRIVNRQQDLKLTLQREGKKWKVTAIEPATFFEPPNFN